MMDILIIGEDPVNLHELVELIVNSPSYPCLAQNWGVFVHSLELDYGNNLDLERKEYEREQLRELLNTWSAEKGRGATLSVLCDALNSCQVEDISDLLEKKYWLVAVKSLRIKLHGRIIRLDEVSNQILEEKYRKIYNELKTSIYTQPIQLFREDLIPKIGTNYIPRTLQSSRSKANSDTGISEDDLLKIAQNNGPIVISDSPGMGKTLLLANLAMKVKVTNDAIPIFVFLNDLATKCHSPSSFVALASIAECASKNEVTKLIFEEILKNRTYTFHLFLDAYDDVCDVKDGLNLVDNCLSQLKGVENFRIYVTTRPHFRNRLEALLNVISYEILPFSKSEQIQFIVNYWAQMTSWFGGNQDENFKIYAEKCLEMLTQQFPDKGQEIAGIPLHCMQLARAFLGDAMTVKTWTCTCGRLTNVFQAKSLFLMYRSLVDMKFRRILPESYFSHSVKYWLEGSVMTNYFNAHVHEALLLLFPDSIEIFESDLNGEIDENILYSIGLLEMCPRENGRKFVDKRFAEYMLADYLVKNLTINHDRKCFRMLLEVFFQHDGVEIDPPQFNPKINKIYGLKYPVMNYFVNLLLDDQRQYKYYPSVDKLSSHSLIEFEPLCKAVELCALHELRWSFRFTSNLLHHVSLSDMNLNNLIDLREKYFRHLPFLVAGRSNNARLIGDILEFMKNTFGIELTSHKYKFDRLNNYPWVKHFTPLHMAVYKGKFDVARYLVGKYEQEDQFNNLKYLLHFCARYSAKDNDALIDEKLAIIRLLVSAGGKYNLDLLKEKQYGHKASEVEDVHPRLHARLLELEKDSSKIPLQQLPDPIAANEAKNENLIVAYRNKGIGTGGTSLICEGTFAGRLVAVKVMRVYQDDVESVKREIQTLIHCDDHDNIVKYHCESHSELNGQIEYPLAMELCQSDLAEFIKNRDAYLQKWNIVEIPSSIEVLRQITEGLCHLHTRNEPIIHRDLKPENILVKVRHGKLVVKLTDFGISKVIADGKTHYTLKDYAGTPGWIAPELICARRNKKEYLHLTLKADIFSLGCVFWYVLSNGMHPFARDPSSYSEYEPKLETSSLDNQTSHYSIVRLILFMIAFEEKDRPSIEDVKNHPIFWPAERRLSFLIESFDTSGKNKVQLTQVENWLKRNYQKLAGGRSHSNFDVIFISNVKGKENGWLDCFNENVQNALSNQNSKNPTQYDGKSLIELVRGMRNLKAHFGEKDASVQNEVGHSTEDFLNYWHSRFPFLLDYVWTALQPIRNSSLDKYYEGVHFDFSKIAINENKFVV